MASCPGAPADGLRLGTERGDEDVTRSIRQRPVSFMHRTASDPAQRLRAVPANGRTGDTSAFVDTTVVRAVVGRDVELSVIEAHLAAVTSRGRSLGLVGENGISKSSLLRAASEMAVRKDMSLLAARGSRDEAPVEFAGLRQLLVPTLGAIRGLRTAHRSALESALGLAPPVSSGPLVLLNAVIELPRAVATDRPVLLGIDDLELLDRETARLMALLARRVHDLPVVLLWTATSEGSSTGLDGARVRVDRLGAADAERLVRRSAPKLSDPQIWAPHLTLPGTSSLGTALFSTLWEDTAGVRGGAAANRECDPRTQDDPT